MDAAEIAVVAKKALARMAAQEPAHVFAGIKGVVGGIHRYLPAVDVVFRRVGGKVRLEWWPAESGGVKCYDLPADLERAAGKILDTL